MNVYAATSGGLSISTCSCLGISCTTPIVEPIPTLSEWGLIILGLVLTIFGIVAVTQIASQET